MGPLISGFIRQSVLTLKPNYTEKELFGTEEGGLNRGVVLNLSGLNSGTLLRTTRIVRPEIFPHLGIVFQL